jgi:hypothetical protein
MLDANPPQDAHETLDPADLDGLRALAHRMVDDAFDDLAQLPERPVWRPLPEALAPTFETPRRVRAAARTPPTSATAPTCSPT